MFNTTGATVSVRGALAVLPSHDSVTLREQPYLRARYSGKPLGPICVSAHQPRPGNCPDHSVQKRTASR